MPKYENNNVNNMLVIMTEAFTDQDRLMLFIEMKKIIDLAFINQELGIGFKL